MLHNKLKVENDRITGAIDEFGIGIYSTSSCINNGTSLEGRIFVGLQAYSAGRLGEQAAIGLSDSLHRLGIETKNLKQELLPE